MKQAGLRPDDPRHGTYTGYLNWKCRCDQCKSAFRAYMQNIKVQAKAQLAENLDDPRHGTPTGYKYGCRCDRCKQALSDSIAEFRDALRRDGNHPSHGTKRAFQHGGCRCEKCQKQKNALVTQRQDLYASYLSEMSNDVDDPRHGTTAGYQYGCRCQRCMKAPREHRADLKRTLVSDPNNPLHGTERGYAAGCRCKRCSPW